MDSRSARRALPRCAGERCPVDAIGLLTPAASRGSRAGISSRLWASDDRDRERGYAVNVRRCRTATASSLLEHTLPDASRRVPGPRRRCFPPPTGCSAPRSISSAIASEADDQRPWMWQASWPIDHFPLRRDFDASPKWQPGEEDYPFVRVEGDGVHEIPVGPVHAGIIEPGHFRFQVVGEKVLRLEERARLRRTRASKSASKRMHALTAHRLAGRVSGDSTVAYAWAYAQALESIAGTDAAAARAVAARARARARAHRQPSGRPRLPRQRRRIRVRPRAVLAPEGARAAH